MDALSIEVDGTDPLRTYEAIAPLVRRVRQGEGPAFVHLHLGLLDAHSSSTDIRRYRTKEEIEETTRTKDPVTILGRHLVSRGVLTDSDLERIRDQTKERILQAEDQVLAEPEPAAGRVLEHVLEVPKDVIPPNASARHMPMIDALNDGLVEIVKRDPGFFVYGQDCGSPIGGVFNATLRLVKEFPGTAISSALNEQLIVGIVAGCGMVDGRARCGEIQFVDYHQSATQTIRLAARFHYQTYGAWNVPVVLRMKSGSGGGGPISDSGSGGGAFGHSNAGDNWFTTIPGAITICPATPYDTKGLLIAASRAQCPVIFLERGRLYRAEVPRVHKDGEPIAQLADLWNVPDGYYTEPIGVARTLRIGQGAPVATVVSWGMMLLESAIAAARFAAASGKAVELVDLRTLAPFDEAAVAASVRKTNRAIVVTEEADLTSFGRHVHSWIAEHLFHELDNPPLFISAVAAPPAPYDAPEETAFFPSADDIARGLEKLAHE
jgi:2-oxoisovalerate dehydrogenase E1 component